MNKIEEIIEDPLNIFSIINEMIDAFPSLFRLYNGYDKTADNFYYVGYCVSFAYILFQVFRGYVENLV